jgi:type II secretory pathway pseudopilin PulG
MTVFQPSNRSAGLTLIELLVVLVVLVALAGILTPLLPAVLQQSHGASSADNMKEIAKAVQLFQTSNSNRYPNGWDALFDETNSLIATTTGLTYEDLASPSTLTAAQADRVAEALVDVGITTLREHNSATTNATFEPYSGADITIATGPTAGEVTLLTAAGAAALNLEATGPNIVAYVAVGVGAQNTAVGRSMLEAPVHFLEAGENPVEVYARFLAVFAVPVTGPTRLAGIATIDGGGLLGLGDHLNEFYEANAN